MVQLLLEADQVVLRVEGLLIPGLAPLALGLELVLGGLLSHSAGLELLLGLDEAALDLVGFFAFTADPFLPGLLSFSERLLAFQVLFLFVVSELVLDRD